jgi:hypothetical protein
MTKEKRKAYQEPELLREILVKALKGKKFTLDCGHHVTIGHHLGNDITIYNGKELRIICTLCSY